MSDLTAQIEIAIRARKLLRRGERILVAVSGGVDSMVLLHLLTNLATAYRWRLHVGHFNHKLRGRASDEDERFVKRISRELGLPFTSRHAEVRSLAQARGESIEMVARDLRHRFLAETARRQGCRKIALAHQADDQAELFFIRLFRGAGGEGLGGMKWLSPSPTDRRIGLVRPLLATGREELVGFAAAEKIRFREDASNDSKEMLRNRIRHELLPLLRQHYQPAIRKILERTMELVSGDAEVVTTAARRALRLKPCALASWPVGVQRRLIYLQLLGRGLPGDFELIESLRTQNDHAICINSRMAVACDGTGRLHFTARRLLTFGEGRREVELLGRVGTIAFGGGRLRWRIAACTGHRIRPNVPGCESFDADRVGRKIVLRHWQAGDRFWPIGMKSPVKLQDWFTNRKVSAFARRRLVLAETANGEVFWIEGQRISEVAKLKPATKRRLIWCWERG